MKTFEQFQNAPSPGVSLAVGGGTFLSSWAIKLKDDQQNKPKKPIQYFCDIVPGRPPQLVLSLEKYPKSVATANTLPTPKLALQNLQRSVISSPLTPTSTLVNNAQTQTTVNGDNGSCTEDSTDIFVLLQKKRQRR